MAGNVPETSFPLFRPETDGVENGGGNAAEAANELETKRREVDEAIERAGGMLGGLVLGAISAPLDAAGSSGPESGEPESPGPESSGPSAGPPVGETSPAAAAVPRGMNAAVAMMRALQKIAEDQSRNETPSGVSRPGLPGSETEMDLTAAGTLPPGFPDAFRGRSGTEFAPGGDQSAPDQGLADLQRIVSQMEGKTEAAETMPSGIPDAPQGFSGVEPARTSGRSGTGRGRADLSQVVREVEGETGAAADLPPGFPDAFQGLSGAEAVQSGDQRGPDKGMADLKRILGEMDGEAEAAEALPSGLPDAFRGLSGALAAGRGKQPGLSGEGGKENAGNPLPAVTGLLEFFSNFANQQNQAPDRDTASRDARTRDAWTKGDPVRFAEAGTEWVFDLVRRFLPGADASPGAASGGTPDGSGRTGSTGGTGSPREEFSGVLAGSFSGKTREATRGEADDPQGSAGREGAGFAGGTAHASGRAPFYPLSREMPPDLAASIAIGREIMAITEIPLSSSSAKVAAGVHARNDNTQASVHNMAVSMNTKMEIEDVQRVCRKMLNDEIEAAIDHFDNGLIA